MGTCINHPDRDTPYICMKHQLYLCEDCLKCRDPKIYCKHRSACPIWFMGKRKKGWEAEDRIAGAVSVQVPEEALARKLKIAGMGRAAAKRLNGLVKEIDPMLQAISLTLAPPTLDDSLSDLDRLNRKLKQQGCEVVRLNVGIKVMRQLAEDGAIERVTIDPQRLVPTPSTVGGGCPGNLRVGNDRSDCGTVEKRHR